jgi:molybdopterin molybdotransferase
LSDRLVITEEEARERILENVRPLPARAVPITDALDCFAAADVAASIALPVFDNSAMDGYAIAAASGKRLRVTGEQPAGLDRQLRVGPGEAVRIFTGAPIPAGADTVVMQEEVTRTGDEIEITGEFAAGDFIRRRGCELSAGQKIVSRGERIRATTLALLASQGLSDVEVGARANAAVLSTGDELVISGEPLQAGQIYDSNSVLLNALLRRAGAAVQSVEHSGDSVESLRRAIARGADTDLLVITGGVSVGEHDLVSRVLKELGAKIDIWRVAIKPGKPFLFARLQRARELPSPQSSPSGRGGRGAASAGRSDARSCFVFGLPGNPVSAYVTFFRFVRPALLRMAGGSDAELKPLSIRAQLIVDLANDGDRVHYIRGRLNDGSFTPVGRQESHALFGLSQSNAMLRLGAHSELNAGSAVDVEVWE